MRADRAAPLLVFALLVAAGLFVASRFIVGTPIDTDILSLLPESQSDPVTAAAMDRANGVAANQIGGQRTRLAQTVVLVSALRGASQPPMQVQLRLDLACVRVCPLAAGFNNNRRLAKDVCKLAQRSGGGLVALHAYGHTFSQVF